MTKEAKTKKYNVVPYKIDENKFIEVAQAGDSVWLTQKQMADLFEVDKSRISRHIQNIFDEKELDKNEVVAFSAHTSNDGKTYNVNCYNLDVIISVGYRVNSKRGIKFRQWATQVLKERMQEEWAKRNGLNRINNLDQRVKKIEELGSIAEFLSQHLYMPINELVPLVSYAPTTLRRYCRNNKVQYKKVKGNGGIRYEILLSSFDPALLQKIFGNFAQYMQIPSLPAPQENNLITSAKELTADALQGNAVAYQKLNKILDGAAAIYSFKE